MKNKNKIICLILLVLTLSGCNPSEQNIEYNDKNVKNREFYDVYEITTEESEFNDFVRNNPIDDKFNTEYYIQASTVNEWLTIQSKYCEIWMSELEKSLDSLYQVLNESDKAVLVALQEDWLSYTNKSLSFEHSLLSEKNDLNMGNMFVVFQKNSYREAFRNRTIRIKYIHYLLETNGDECKDIQDYNSLRFYYEC